MLLPIDHGTTGTTRLVLDGAGALLGRAEATYDPVMGDETLLHGWHRASEPAQSWERGADDVGRGGERRRKR